MPLLLHFLSQIPFVSSSRLSEHVAFQFPDEVEWFHCFPIQEACALSLLLFGCEKAVRTLRTCWMWRVRCCKRKHLQCFQGVVPFLKAKIETYRSFHSKNYLRFLRHSVGIGIWQGQQNIFSQVSQCFSEGLAIQTAPLLLYLWNSEAI